MPAHTRYVRLALATLLVAAIGACGVSGDDDQVSTRPAAETESTTTTAEADAEAEADDPAKTEEDPEDEQDTDDGGDTGNNSFFGGDDDTNSGSRPSAAEISAALEEEIGVELPAELKTCVGEALHDSDLPNGVLRAIVEGREAEVDKDNVDDYEKTVMDITTDCATASAGDLGIDVDELEDGGR